MSHSSVDALWGPRGALAGHLVRARVGSSERCNPPSLGTTWMLPNPNARVLDAEHGKVETLTV